MRFTLSVGHSRTGDSGKGHFLKQLCDALAIECSVRIVDGDQPSDIHLAVISGLKKRSLNVVRIDGVYYDKGRMSQNESIRSAIKGADGVIYQSEWSRVLATKMLSIKPKRSIVIPNGVDMKLVNSAVPVDRQGWDFIFTVSAHWRVNKRFEAVLAAYRSLVSKFPDRKIGMFVLGESPVKVGKNERIRLFGRVGLSEVFSTLKSSNALVHICHLDACPNSVVEALSCRVPVVCNNIGGTPELVKGDGVIVDLDKEYDFRPIKSMKQVGSGSVDVEKLSEGMAKMLLWKNAVERPDLDIRNVARRYCEYFEQILEGRKS